MKKWGITLILFSIFFISTFAVVDGVGTPKILKCEQNIEFCSGFYYAEIEVQDISGAGGNFLGEIDCTGEIYAGLGTYRVEPNAIVKMEASISGINTNEENSSRGICKVKIVDVKSGDEDTCSFEVTVKNQGGVVCQREKYRTNVKDWKLITCNGTAEIIPGMSEENFTMHSIERCDSCFVDNNGIGHCIKEKLGFFERIFGWLFGK